MKKIKIKLSIILLTLLSSVLLIALLFSLFKDRLIIAIFCTVGIIVVEYFITKLKDKNRIYELEDLED